MQYPQELPFLVTLGSARAVGHLAARAPTSFLKTTKLFAYCEVKPTHRRVKNKTSRQPRSAVSRPTSDRGQTPCHAAWASDGARPAALGPGPPSPTRLPPSTAASFAVRLGSTRVMQDPSLYAGFCAYDRVSAAHLSRRPEAARPCWDRAPPAA